MPNMYQSPEEEANMARCRFQNLFAQFTWWQTPGGRVLVVVRWRTADELIDGGLMMTHIELLEKGKEEPVTIPLADLHEIVKKGQLIGISMSSSGATGKISAG